MKAISNLISLMLIVLVAFTIKSFAAGDTLYVYANGPFLNDIIGADTTATGEQAHNVYKLVSRDTTYLYSGTISVKSNFTIVGELGPDDRPPTLQPAVLSDGSIPSNPFAFNGANTNVVFKNLYFLGIAPNGSVSNDGIAIQVSADNIRVSVDNCVFEEWRAFAIGYNGNWDKFFITNSKFRNMNHPNQWYVGEVLRNEWPGAAYTDSVVMKYNTIFCVNGYAAAPVTKYYMTYFEFNHNNVVYTFKNPFFIFNVTDAKINNNIFYGAWAGGISKQEYPWWDQLWSPEIGSIIDLDTLDLAKDSVFNPEDIGKENFRWLSEAKRTVEVKNNAYYWPQQMVDFWTSWNDTATVDSIYTVSWMNDRTTNMFNDKEHWPGFVEENNINVDPQFGPSINEVMNNTSGEYGIGLFNWFTQIRTGTAATDLWGYKLTQVGSNADWVPTWPLPEKDDMHYSNTSLLTHATDDLPLGDPYWILGVTGIEKEDNILPQNFTLYNNYPNPFNPSTTIKFNIPETGDVSLKIYNVMGQLVKTVVNESAMEQGQYKISLDMSNLSSGIYFYSLKYSNRTITKKMILMK